MNTNHVIIVVRKQGPARWNEIVSVLGRWPVECCGVAFVDIVWCGPSSGNKGVGGGMGRFVEPGSIINVMCECVFVE